MRFVVVLIAFLAVGTVAPASAQVPVTSYQPGWSLVGGPAGMDFSAASALVAYAGGNYQPVTSPTATGSCAGYWAYFPGPTNVAVPSATDKPVSCALQVGWNLVGNPFDVPALLPPGVAGQRWDPGSQAYVADTGIRVGGGLWVYAPGATTLQLTPVAAGGLTIAVPPAQSQPYQIHIGEYLTILVANSNGTPAYDAKADATYLQLIGSGPTGPAAVQAYHYTWKAVTTGSTLITLDPACLKHGCAIASLAVRVDILP